MRILHPEYKCGNSFVRINEFTEGWEDNPVAPDWLPGHWHFFDHMTYVVRGWILVVATTKSGRLLTREYRAGEWFLVTAETAHAVVILSAGGARFDCIYSRKDPAGRIVVVSNGWDHPHAYATVHAGAVVAEHPGDRDGLDLEDPALPAHVP